MSNAGSRSVTPSGHRRTTGKAREHQAASPDDSEEATDLVISYAANGTLVSVPRRHPECYGTHVLGQLRRWERDPNRWTRGVAYRAIVVADHAIRRPSPPRMIEPSGHEPPRKARRVGRECPTGTGLMTGALMTAALLVPSLRMLEGNNVA